MKLLLTGAHGLLGQSVVANILQDARYALLATDLPGQTFFDTGRVPYTPMDITDPESIRRVVQEFQPDAVINAAAFTHVDRCEVEREVSWALNVTAVQHLVDALAETPEAHLVHISTDYVFDGTGPECYTEDSPVNPVNYYGEQKLASEKIVLAKPGLKTVLRTQGLYGTGHEIKKDYVRWVLTMLERGEPFGAIIDQRQNWTHADDLALMCLRAVDIEAGGLYHACGAEPASRYEFALAIADAFGYDPRLVREMETRELHQEAKRPVNSSFCIDKMKRDFSFEPHGIAGGLQKYRALSGRETAYIQQDLI